MNPKFYIFCSWLLFFAFTNAQEKEYNTAQIIVNDFVHGTLLTPYSEENTALVIFVMDAGEINRDGNDRLSKNNTFKKLAIELAKQGIATFRYDKRILRASALGLQAQNIKLQDFVTDLQAAIHYFVTNNSYQKIVILGHGQGSLVGMLAINDHIDSFISIAGNAQSIDNIIVQQLEQQAPGLDNNAARAFAEIKVKGSTKNYDPVLENIFGSEVQPFIKSWMQYNPTEIISEITIPSLIIQGDKDLQVAVEEAQELYENASDAELKIFSSMNHILRKIDGDRLENQKSYNEYWRDIMPELIKAITTFVNK